MKISLLILLFTSSALYGQHKTPDSLVLKYKLNHSPPKNKYKFSKDKFTERLKKNNLVDTNCVYVINSVEQYDMEGKTLTDTSLIFIRFYGNGVVFWSMGYKTIPHEKDYNNTEYGRWCMYTRKKDKIIIENHVSNNPLLPNFEYNYIKIENGNLRFYKYKIGRLFTNAQPKLNWLFKRTPMKFKDYVINWQ